MDESTATSIFNWLGDHPILSGVFIFFIAMIESLAIVGILVPGVVLMLIIGAYLATDQFSFSYAVMLAFAGAVVGDGISYYLGYHYKNRLVTLWPLSRYPDTFEKGIQFFKRHGYKSIILGRFIGPLRALIPAIAGMFQMPRTQFFISNVLSALVWAPVVLLPGYIIGLSLEFASDIAARLIVLVVIVGSLLWFIFWVFKLFYLYLLPRFDDAVVLLLNWSHKHPLPGKVPSVLLENKYPDKTIFSVLFLLYIFFSLVFFALPSVLGIFDHPGNIELFLNDIVPAFNSPLSNRFIASIVNLINVNWVIVLAVFTLFILISKKHFILVRFYIFTLTLTAVLQLILSNYLEIDPNYNLFGISAYVFLTFVLTFNSTPRRKILYYGICYTLISTVLLSQIYHGSTNLTLLVLSDLFLILWITILTSTYRHHADSNKFTYQFQRKLGLFFLLLISINMTFMPNSFSVKPFQPEILITTNDVWKNYLWKKLPSHRKGFINQTRHPFNIQWLDSKQDIIETIKIISESNDITWVPSKFPRISAMLQSLNPQANINALAIFPHLNNGVYEQLRFTRSSENGILVLRLWKTKFKIKNFDHDQQKKPLWHGTLTKLVIINRAGMKFLKSSLINEVTLSEFASTFENTKHGKIINYNKNLNIVLISPGQN